MRSLSDVELITLFREQGQQDAFTTLFNRYQEKLTNTLISRLGDPDTAEEVVQKTFVAVYQNIYRFDGSKGAFERWLFVAAFNFMRKEIRNAKVAGRPQSCISFQREDRSGSEGWFAEPVDPGVQCAQDELIDEEWRAEVQKFLEELPFLEGRAKGSQPVSVLRENLRQAFTLIYVEGLSYAEASKQTGISIQTLNSRALDVVNQMRIAFADMPQNITGLLDALRSEAASQKVA